LRIFAVRNRLSAESAAAALRGKKIRNKKLFDFRCLRGCCESVRQSRLTFISAPTNCATVSLNKGAF